MTDPVRREPVAQREQTPHSRRKLRDVLRPPASPIRHARARSHMRLMDIEARRPLNNRLHHPPPQSINTTSPRGLGKQTNLSRGGKHAFPDGEAFAAVNLTIDNLDLRHIACRRTRDFARRIAWTIEHNNNLGTH